MDENKHPIRSFIANRKKRVRVEGPYNAYYDNISERFAFAQVILYLLLLIFVAIMFISNISSLTYNNLYYFFKDLSASMENWDAAVGDRIIYSAGENESFSSYRGGVAVAGSQSVCAYTATGRRTLYEKSNMANPQVTSSGKYILVYDGGGKTVMLCNSFSWIFQREYEYTVNMAKVSDSGVFAVVTDGERNASDLYVYNSNFSLLIKPVNATYPITSIAISPNGSECSYVSVIPQNGKFVSNITRFEVGENPSSVSAETYGYVYQCEFLPDGQLLCFGECGLFTVSKDGTILPISGSEGTVRLFGLSVDGCAWITVDDAGKEKVILYDGNELKSFDFPGHCKTVSYGYKTLFLTTDDGLLRISADGIYDLYSCGTDDATVCICSADTVYLCRKTSAEYITFP